MADADDKSELDGPIYASEEHDGRQKGAVAETTSDEPVAGREKGWLLAKGNSLVQTCVVVLAVFGLIAIFVDVRSDEYFGQIVDIFKLVLTTVLAYLFGAHGFNDNGKGDK